MRKLLYACLLVLPMMVFGQEQKPITGTVTDDQGKPVANATVESENGVMVKTDANGYFEIQANEGEMITITPTKDSDPISEFATTEPMKINAGNVIAPQKEVVVIGYGAAKKRDLAGSIVKVEGKDIADKPNANPVNSLQGKVTGLSVVASGKPGQEPDVRIRGTVSRYNTKPLYVVDGIFNDNINFVNPNDIESIEVLKDPSSLAIFGVRGANGVIIVTTKKAKSGRTTVNFTSSIGIKNITNRPEMTNAEDFKTLYNERLINDGLAPYDKYDVFNGDTNWIKQIENNNAITTSNNISISHGSEFNRFYLGVGYTTDEGLINYEEYKKLTFNMNDELKLSEAIKVGAGLSAYRAKLPQLHDFRTALIAAPIVDPINEGQGGVYNVMPKGMGDAQIDNPLAAVEGKRYTSIGQEYRFVGNIYTEAKFLKDFTFRIAYMGDLGVNSERSYTPIVPMYNLESKAVATLGSNNLTSVTQKQSQYQKFQQDYLLSYKKEIGEHNFSVMAGYTTYYSDKSEIIGSVNQYIGRDPIPNDERFWYTDVYPFGDPKTRFADSEEWDTSTQSYLLRALYNYGGKYILNASFRRDGSSELAPDNRWDNFYSIGAAWEVTKEKFMENQNAIDFLKLKGSYGKLGNAYTPEHYMYLPVYKAGNTAVFGETLVPAYVLAWKPDEDLGWETITSYEFGLESAFLDKRLKFDANYYHKKTEDLLCEITDSYNNKFYTNAGEIENKGFEFSTSWNDMIGENFEYSLGANLTTIDNKVKSVIEDGFTIYDGNSITTAGYPIGSFYGYEVEGIYQTYADMIASPDAGALGTYGPGDFKYKDVNGDGKITPGDRKVIGNPTPDFTYGFNAYARYKNIDLSIDVNGVYGNEIYRDWGVDNSYTQFNYRQDRMDRWTGSGTSNWEPKASGNAYNKLPSTYMIEDGSYVRIRNIQLGYNFNPEMFGGAVQALRLYINCQNLYTWQHNSGFSPEVGGSPTKFGADDGGYPLPRITSMGINVTF